MKFACIALLILGAALASEGAVCPPTYATIKQYYKDTATPTMAAWRSHAKQTAGLPTQIANIINHGTDPLTTLQQLSQYATGQGGSTLAIEDAEDFTLWALQMTMTQIDTVPGHNLSHWDTLAAACIYGTSTAYPTNGKIVGQCQINPSTSLTFVKTAVPTLAQIAACFPLFFTCSALSPATTISIGSVLDDMVNCQMPSG